MAKIWPAEASQDGFIGNIVLWEAGVEVSYCREDVTVGVSQTIVKGDLLYVDGGKYYKYSDSDAGTNPAVGVALGDVTSASPAVYPNNHVLALVRGPAVVRADGLTTDDAEGLADLASAGIVVRSGPATTFEMA